MRQKWEFNKWKSVLEELEQLLLIEIYPIPLAPSMERRYDFAFGLVSNDEIIEFCGHFHTWDEHKDEIIELLRKQLKTCPTSSSASNEQ